MKKLYSLLLVATTLFTLALSEAKAAVAPILLTSPDDYQVIAISPNGKWATGVYVDYGQNTFGFLWNLESNKTQLLSTTPLRMVVLYQTTVLWLVTSRTSQHQVVRLTKCRDTTSRTDRHLQNRH